MKGRCGREAGQGSGARLALRSPRSSPLPGGVSLLKYLLPSFASPCRLREGAALPVSPAQDTGAQEAFAVWLALELRSLQWKEVGAGEGPDHTAFGGQS